MNKRPSVSEQELDKIEAQFEMQTKQINEMTIDHMNMAPKPDTEPQTKLSQSEILDSKDIYLKPIKSIASREKFNENYRSQYNFDKEYVYFIAENSEIIGEELDFWTKPYAGMPAEEWKVPVNKPVWGPRYVAEQIKRCSYHRLTMNQKMISGEDGLGMYTGGITVDSVIQRLDARPASKRKSIFMGSHTF
jgi:hypothetical protein